MYLTSPERDYIQKNLATKGVPYELSMLTDMKRRLQVESTVLDVGANIGNHTFYLAQVLRCHVIAFEANDELAHAMDITASEAGLEESVTVHAFALGDKPGFAEFEQAMPENLGGQRLRKGSGRIKIRTLDSFGISAPVSAVKIDVEGMELDVLKGGKKLIESNLPILYVESQTKESFLEISSFLKTLGYCYRDTFNATPTHLFIHKTKLEKDEQPELSVLNRVEHEYDLIANSKKLKKDLIDCQMKYREVCQINSSLKSENEQLQKQVQNSKAEVVQAGSMRLQTELDQTTQKLVETNQLVEVLRDEVARERREKEFQIQQFSKSNLGTKEDANARIKLAAEVERLVAENRSQCALLHEQEALKSALEDNKKKCAEMSFIMDNLEAELAQVRAEKQQLLAKIKEKEDEGTQFLHLKEQLGDMKKKHEHLQLQLEHSQEEKAELQARVEDLNQTLSVTQRDACRIEALEHEILLVEKQRVEQSNAMESLKAKYDRYIQALRVLHEQRQRDDEQHMRILIQKKMESLAPLQANQEKLDKLIEYRNDIEKIYSERTPLLKDLDSDQAAEQIQEKRAALEALNQQLAEFNNRQVFATVVDSSEGPSRPSHPK